MDLNVVPLLRCPTCYADGLHVARVARRVTFDEAPPPRLWDGVLGCQQCGALFPVCDGVATLLVGEPTEASAAADSPLVERREMPSREQRLVRVAELVGPRCAPDAAADFDYRVYHAEDRECHVRAVEGLVREPVETILDIGGGQGGLLTCFSRRYQPRLSIMVDLDPLWVRVAAVRNPEVTVIRADATNLPFRTASFNLVVTTSTLEHVVGWRTMLDEVARVADQAYLSYGYNRFFPYEKGHIDAPFVTFLPKSVGQYIAYAWLQLIGKPRSLNAIRTQLEQTMFLSRNDAVRVLNRAGMTTRSVFRGFLRASVRADYHYFAGAIKRYLARHTTLLDAISWFFDTTQSEPIVYLFASH